MRSIAILGSTGSIGCNAIHVVEALGEGFRVVGLAANQDWESLARQALRCKPVLVAIADERCVAPLKSKLDGLDTKVLGGADGIRAVASMPEADTAVVAISGAAALPATLAAIESGKRVALANKESLVMAGSVVMRRAAERGVQIIPVDSEHSAIFQSVQAGRWSEVKRIVLTASGGPFRLMPKEKLNEVTPEDALRHPNWSMGPKVTIDSATLMNKALEVIEAHWLFDLRPEQIVVVVHPQSIVHSMVEFIDGAVIAQLGVPDMRVPIQYALTYPERRQGSVPPPDLTKIGKLDFEEPDLNRFPCLSFGFRAAEIGGTMGAVMNAANEVAVAAFLDRRISFHRIPELIGRTMDAHSVVFEPSLEQILQLDEWARMETSRCLNG